MKKALIIATYGAACSIISAVVIHEILAKREARIEKKISEGIVDKETAPIIAKRMAEKIRNEQREVIDITDIQES